ncbi:MAG: DUF805 domain-containing protein [Gammaproteobacteria bacterium]|nr:DUF805 domain-containing protein [Gammaproteobacteria bacterium]
MDFDTALETCLSKYFTFSGRARRAELWWFVVFYVAVSPIVLMFDVFANFEGPILWTIFSFAMIAPFLAVSVRRLHDRNVSGWWMLLNLVPIVGIIPTLILFILPGTKGANRFGPDYTFSV